MSCTQCKGIEKTFNRKTALKELENYHIKGPRKSSKMLLDHLKREDINGLTLLDIGGGVGVIQHELLKSGVSSAINVDASPSYLSVSKEEAKKQGYANRISYHQGNFIDLAPAIPPVNIVTLERVICCYPDLLALVASSSEKARNFYCLVYPRENILTKLGFAVVNFIQKVRRDNFRIFLHSRRDIHKVLYDNNFTTEYYRKTGFWQVEIFKKEASAA
ncbi:MAG: methyltransferase domain-containing protein [Candidatus Odinarchaeota archaeon]